MSSKSMGNKGLYQSKKPITSKDLGKDLLKSGQGTSPHQGKKEIERRQKQAEKAELKSQLRIQK